VFRYEIERCQEKACRVFDAAGPFPSLLEGSGAFKGVANFRTRGFREATRRGGFQSNRVIDPSVSFSSFLKRSGLFWSVLGVATFRQTSVAIPLNFPKPETLDFSAHEGVEKIRDAEAPGRIG